MHHVCVHLQDHIDINIPLDEYLVPYYRDNPNNIEDLLNAVGIARSDSKLIASHFSNSDNAVGKIKTDETNIVPVVLAEHLESIEELEMSKKPIETPVTKQNQETQTDPPQVILKLKRFICMCS